ncbi:hypothetical protein Tco_1359119 [Tanacetum coccineum]
MKADRSTPCGLPARTDLTCYNKSKHFKSRSSEHYNDQTSPDVIRSCLCDIFLISLETMWRHYLQCPQGLLGNHFEKLIKCDPHLNFLSQQAEVELESPYFEPMTSVFDEPNETNEYDLSREARPDILDLHRTTSPYSSSRSELHDPMVD